MFPLHLRHPRRRCHAPTSSRHFLNHSNTSSSTASTLQPSNKILYRVTQNQTQSSATPLYYTAPVDSLFFCFCEEARTTGGSSANDSLVRTQGKGKMMRRLSITASRRMLAQPQPRLVVLRPFSLPARPEPVRVRLPEDDTQGVKPRSIPKWFKKEGEAVNAGDPLCEVDAGDVVYDFNSPVKGILVRITAKEGSVDLKGECCRRLSITGRRRLTLIGHRRRSYCVPCRFCR